MTRYLGVGGGEARLEDLALVGVGEEEDVLAEVEVDAGGGGRRPKLLDVHAALVHVLDPVGKGQFE